MGAFFFDFVRLEVANDASVSDSSTDGDLGFGDEKDCIGAFLVSNALRETTEFVCERSFPGGDSLVVAFH